jgi:hypothetical protein
VIIPEKKNSSIFSSIFSPSRQIIHRKIKKPKYLNFLMSQGTDLANLGFNWASLDVALCFVELFIDKKTGKKSKSIAEKGVRKTGRQMNLLLGYI